jgi:hypothetical protein
MIYEYIPTSSTIRRWVQKYKESPVWQKHYKKYVAELQRLK